MTTTKGTGYNNLSADKTSQAILYEGANQSQLAILFKCDKSRVKARLLHVSPDGMRSGTPIWKISTAAPYLVKPLFDVENYIRNMNHADLPPHLTKEFWAGQRAKYALEEEKGDLWRTVDVMDAITELLRIVRMSVMLIPDKLAKVTTLSTKQRELLTEQNDALLDELRKIIIRKFEEAPNGLAHAETAEGLIAQAEAETPNTEVADGEQKEEDWSDL